MLIIGHIAGRIRTICPLAKKCAARRDGSKMINEFKYLPLHEEKGSAVIDGKKVRLCINASNGTPMVVSENRIFTMSWDEILEKAVEEGIISRKVG